MGSKNCFCPMGQMIILTKQEKTPLFPHITSNHQIFCIIGFTCKSSQNQCVLVPFSENPYCCKNFWLRAFKNWARLMKKIDININECSPIIQHSKKKINFRKIKLIIDPENWLRKLRKSNFWPPSFKIKISFQDVDLDAKIYWIVPVSLWNSTTFIMLLWGIWT